MPGLISPPSGSGIRPKPEGRAQATVWLPIRGIDCSLSVVVISRASTIAGTVVLGFSPVSPVLLLISSLLTATLIKSIGADSGFADLPK